MVKTAMAKGDLFMQTETTTRELGWITSRRGLVVSSPKTAIATRDIEKIILRKEPEKSNDRMVLPMLGHIKMGKKKARVCFCGLIRLLTRENIRRIIYMAWGPIRTRMGRNILGSGIIIRCTEKVFLLGETAEYTTANTTTIKRRATVFSHTQMERFIRASGSQESSTVRA